MVELLAEVLGQARFGTARTEGLALDGFTEVADMAERLFAQQHIDHRTAHRRPPQ